VGFRAAPLPTVPITSLMRRLAFTLFACACLAGGVGTARAQDFDQEPDERPAERLEHASRERPALPIGGAHRPGAANRLVRLFDFDERATNSTDLPESWFRAQNDPAVRERPGFPIFNLARLTPTGDEERGDAVRMTTRGGSASLRLRPGVIPVFPNADYRVSVLVRTDGLRHARARLVARFVDADGQAMTRSEAASALLLTEGEWERVFVDLRGDDERAAFIQIDLELLQPEQFEPSRLGERDIWVQDFEGAAWFDDVAVVQMPRIELATTAPGNAVLAPESPELSLLVRDLTGESLSVTIRVLDIDGREADRWTTRAAGGRIGTAWRPSLDRLGWYRAVVEVEADGQRVGSSWCDFVWVPPLTVTTAPRRRTGELAGVDANADRERNRFVVDVSSMPEGLIAPLPAMVRRLGVGSVVVPVWGPWAEGRDAVAQHALLEPMLEALLADWLTVTVAVTSLPPTVASSLRISAESVLALFEREPGALARHLDPLLDRYGQRIGRWQVGASSGERSGATPEGVRGAIARARARLAALVPGPTVGIGWAIEEDMGVLISVDRASEGAAPAPGAVTIAWANAFPASAIAEALAHFRDQGPGARGAEATLRLETPDLELLGPRVGSAVFAQRVLEAWRVAAPTERGRAPTRLAIPEPWQWIDARRPQPMPEPTYAVWRSMIERLAYRRVVGELRVAPGVRAWILAPTPEAPVGRGGALVLWTDHLPVADHALELFLGHDEIRALDLYGNARTLHPTTVVDEDDPTLPARPVHRVHATPEPVFLEGIDVALLRFITGFTIEPPLLPAASEVHRRELRVSNPWASAINGRWALIQPGGRASPEGVPDRSWSLTPRRSGFGLAPGETSLVPMSIVLSPAQEAGPLPFVFEFEVLAGDRAYPRMRLTVPMEVGLDDLELLLSHRPIPTQVGPDVLVEATVTNLGEEETMLEVVAFAPGFPQQRATIPALPPGERTVVRFQYPDGAARLRGQRVSVRVANPDTTARLNKSVAIE